jgi:hypothetical protein
LQPAAEKDEIAFLSEHTEVVEIVSVVSVAAAAEPYGCSVAMAVEEEQIHRLDADSIEKEVEVVVDSTVDDDYHYHYHYHYHQTEEVEVGEVAFGIFAQQADIVVVVARCRLN